MLQELEKSPKKEKPEEREKAEQRPVTPETPKAPEKAEKELPTREDLALQRTREYIKREHLELSDSTVDQWRDYLKERHHILVSETAREYCEREGLAPEKEADPSYYIGVLNDRGGVEALGDEEKERLSEMETLMNIAEVHGGSMSIDERYLFLHYGEQRVAQLEEVIQQKKEGGTDFSKEEAELRKVRGMQERIISETEGRDLRKDASKEADEAVRDIEDYIKKQFEGQPKKEKKVKDEIARRKEEKAEKIIAQEIKKRVGSFEKARGGIEKCYGEIKDKILDEFLRKLETGELRDVLGIKEGEEPKTPEEFEKKAPGILSKIFKKPVKIEEVGEAKEQLKGKGIGWEALKKVGGFFEILAMFILVMTGVIFAVYEKLLKSKDKIKK